MEDPDIPLTLQALKELTIQAVNQCTDPSTLDLVYKILANDIL